MTLSRGRDILAIPGPSIIPDRVLNAMHRAAPNIYEGELVEITETLIADLRRVARTDGKVAIYIGNGHAGWEAAIANILAPGQKALVAASGRFGLGWAATARQMGVEVEVMDFGFRGGIDAGPASPSGSAPTAATRSARCWRCRPTPPPSVRNDVAALRARARRRRPSGAPRHRLHRLPRLRPLRDGRLGRRCDGRRLPEGADDPAGPRLHLPRAARRGGAGALPEPLLGLGAAHRCRRSTTSSSAAPRRRHHLYGLRTALDMILDEEGLERGLGAPRGLRPRRSGRRSRPGAPAGRSTLNIADAGRAQPCGHHHPHRPRRRRAAAPLVPDTAGVTLGIGLSVPGVDPDSVFRIGHMGHLNPPMLLGTLATIEAGPPRPRHRARAGRDRGGHRGGRPGRRTGTEAAEAVESAPKSSRRQSVTVRTTSRTGRTTTRRG